MQKTFRLKLPYKDDSLYAAVSGAFCKGVSGVSLVNAVSVTQYSNMQRTCNTFPNSSVSVEDLASVWEASASHIKTLVDYFPTFVLTLEFGEFQVIGKYTCSYLAPLAHFFHLQCKKYPSSSN